MRFVTAWHSELIVSQMSTCSFPENCFWNQSWFQSFFNKPSFYMYWVDWNKKTGNISVPNIQTTIFDYQIFEFISLIWFVLGNVNGRLRRYSSWARPFDLFWCLCTTCTHFFLQHSSSAKALLQRRPHFHGKILILRTILNPNTSVRKAHATLHQ